MSKRKIVGAFCALGVVWTLAFGGVSLNATGGSSTCDFITGGGFIYPTTQMTGLKGFFAFAAGCLCRSGSGTGTPPKPYWGHLVYHDKAALVKIHSIKITGYKIDTTIVPHPKARLICGTGKTKSGGNVEFLVRAKDAGYGGSNDEFDIQVTGAVTYTTFPTGPHKLGGGMHGGGNVQLHKPHHNSGVFGGTCPPMIPPAGGTFSLTVDKIGNNEGAGTVTSVPPGITCLTGCSIASASFVAGTPVTLTATSPIGTSISWTGCDTFTDNPLGGTATCTVTMTTDRLVTVDFSFQTTMETFLLTVIVNLEGGGTGTVASVPIGILCETDCSESYNSGQMVTLTALPGVATTVQFAFEACDSETATTCTVEMTSDRTVAVTFIGPE